MARVNTVFWIRLGFAALLLATLAAPLARLGWGSSGVLVAEKRNAAEWPGGEAGYLAFPKAFEMAFSDRFGFREEMGRAYRWGLFQLGLLATGSKGVADGRDGWHFLSTGNADDTLATLAGGFLFSDAGLADTAQRLGAWRDWCAARGIRFYLMVLPNKATVYPQYVPARVKVSPSGTRFDQLLAALERAGIPVIAPFDVLRTAGKSDDRLYFRWDTHWTNWGGMLAFGDIVDRLGVDFPEIPPVDWSQVSVRDGSQMGGDLQNFIGLPGAFEDHAPQVVWDSGPKPAGLPRAAIFHDSFVETLRPYFERTFSEVRYEFRTELDGPAIEAFQPDLVIFELVERSIFILPALALPEEAP